MSSNFYLSLGVVNTLIAVYSFAMAYSYGGEHVISSKDAKALIKKDKKNVIVVDVRTKPEWNLGHFKGAIHLPSASINEDSTKELDKTEKTYIIYCNTGQRARNAAEKMKKLGFKNVFYITGTYKGLI